MQNELSISEINYNSIPADRPYFPTKNVQVSSGSQEMALFNMVEPGVAGSHKLESTAYNHPGQHNPSIFANGNKQGNLGGYAPGQIDQVAAKSLMRNISKIDADALGNVNYQTNTSAEGVVVVIDHINKLVRMMGEEELDLWVPQTSPKLREQLSKIGTKLIPILNKYADCIRKLGE